MQTEAVKTSGETAKPGGARLGRKKKRGVLNSSLVLPDAVRVEIGCDKPADTEFSNGKGKRRSGFKKDAAEQPASNSPAGVSQKVGAIREFAEIFNALLDELTKESGGNSNTPWGEACKKTADGLRKAVYCPVELTERNKHISLYEIGVAHAPNHLQAGRLAIYEKDLLTALIDREADVRLLFVKEKGGLLAQLKDILRSLPAMEKHGCTASLAERFKLACEGIQEIYR
ncbi:MAG: hypothetical protein LBR83_02210 [Clostridiales bacterium]|jgi:hypothetical protein|nr:hypothetical protein [Clostridiales bacterium]